MPTPPSHPMRRTVASAVVAGGSLLAAVFPAAGQQVAANTDAFYRDHAAYISSRCDRLLNTREYPGCVTQASIDHSNAVSAAAKATTATAQRESAELRTETACKETLIEMVKGGKKDAVRDAYAGRPVHSVSACEILNSLTKG